MDDKVNGARVAGATIKLTGAGQRPANLEELAARTGLAAAEAKRLLRLVWREKADVRDGATTTTRSPASRVATAPKPADARSGRARAAA